MSKEGDKRDKHTPRQHQSERHGHTYKPDAFVGQIAAASKIPTIPVLLGTSTSRRGREQKRIESHNILEDIV
jgi:hypothetical protein